MPLAPLPVADAFIRAAQQYGIPYNPDFNGARTEGCGFYQVTQAHGARSSTASAYLHPNAARPNLEVRTGVSATRIVVEHGRAVGVEVAPAGGGPTEVLRAEREVIVSSGSVGSPSGWRRNS